MRDFGEEKKKEEKKEKSLALRTVCAGYLDRLSFQGLFFRHGEGYTPGGLAGSSEKLMNYLSSGTQKAPCRGLWMSSHFLVCATSNIKEKKKTKQKNQQDDG